jgi:hypothetical protein
MNGFKESFRIMIYDLRFTNYDGSARLTWCLSADGFT